MARTRRLADLQCISLLAKSASTLTITPLAIQWAVLAGNNRGHYRRGAKCTRQRVFGHHIDASSNIWGKIVDVPFCYVRKAGFVQPKTSNTALAHNIVHRRGKTMTCEPPVHLQGRRKHVAIAEAFITVPCPTQEDLQAGRCCPPIWHNDIVESGHSRGTFYNFPSRDARHTHAHNVWEVENLRRTAAMRQPKGTCQHEHWIGIPDNTIVKGCQRTRVVID